MKSLYVKFKPYNVQTMSTLMNKKVWFSTVYDFNDFNELHYSGLNPEKHECEIFKKIYDQFKNILSEQFNTLDFKHSLLKAWESPLMHTSDNYNDLLRQLEKPEFDFKSIDNGFLSGISKHIAFSSVGIFCASSLSVFEDDSAQLMFAHYADNLEGLAFIYEKVKFNDFNEVRYSNNESSLKPPSTGCVERIERWLNYEFQKNDMNDFLNKSNKWKYENECRLFNKPGEQAIDDLTLKAILYTDRFNGNIETLQQINESVYEGNLFIQKIRHNYGKCKFLIDQAVCKWIQENITS
jgi:hypothetical protein